MIAAAYGAVGTPSKTEYGVVDCCWLETGITLPIWIQLEKVGCSPPPLSLCSWVIWTFKLECRPSRSKVMAAALSTDEFGGKEWSGYCEWNGNHQGSASLDPIVAVPTQLPGVVGVAVDRTLIWVEGVGGTRTAAVTTAISILVLVGVVDVGVTEMVVIPPIWVQWRWFWLQRASVRSKEDIRSIKLELRWPTAWIRASLVWISNFGGESSWSCKSHWNGCISTNMRPNWVNLIEIVFFRRSLSVSKWQLMSTKAYSLSYSCFTVENDDDGNSLVSATVIAPVHLINCQCRNHCTSGLRTSTRFFWAIGCYNQCSGRWVMEAWEGGCVMEWWWQRFNDDGRLMMMCGAPKGDRESISDFFLNKSL